MEFQTGPGAPLMPVEIHVVQEAPVDSYVRFTADGASVAYRSWSLEVKDKNGNVQYFGPYTQDMVRIPGKAILGTQPEGTYQVTMVGKTKDGNFVRKEASVHMVLWKPSTDEEGTRYSVLYEFDESKTIQMYDKYLTEIVIPKLPIGSTVIIHGHTDIIGDANYNQNLSFARSEDVRKIMEKALANAGRTDVKFEEYAFGEDEDLSPFENKYPEERFYNRTVIIEIIPAVK
jgi:outer membrane protein OmpA-like peptidoglycan-associated protein